MEQNEKHCEQKQQPPVVRADADRKYDREKPDIDGIPCESIDTAGHDRIRWFVWTGMLLKFDQLPNAREDEQRGKQRQPHTKRDTKPSRAIHDRERPEMRSDEARRDTDRGQERWRGDDR